MKKRVNGLVLVLLLFALASSALAVQIDTPKFSVAASKNFDINFTTTEDRTCKYSTPFELAYAEMSNFGESGKKVHNISGFDLPAFETEYDFFINCDDGTETGAFKLKANEAYPSIEVAKAANVIQAPLKTTLNIETNTKTSCKYGEHVPYSEMTQFISGTDSVEDNYLKTHSLILGQLIDKTDYTYNVTCKDLAGRTSGVTQVKFNVNTAATPKITNISPIDGSASTSKSVVLLIETNKNSVCKHGIEKPLTEAMGDFNTQAVKHSVNLQLEEGTYTYLFKCTFAGPKELETQTTFTIDTTPPVMLFVDDNQYLNDAPEQFTYYTDRLFVKFEGQDNESGIVKYNYSIRTGSEIIVNWTSTTSKDFKVKNLKLQDIKKYFFKVKAQNNAGQWSAEKESDGVTVDISLNVKQACSNDIKDGDETDVDCGGSCTNGCGVDDSCKTNSDCSSKACEDSRCVAASCSDGIKNQAESDIDCGGTCGNCLLGDMCRTKNDCSSSICAENICVAPGPCFNEMLDSLETDVDCGGICAELKDKQCLLGKQCKADSDCISNTCGIDGKCATKNDRDSDSVFDNKDNCPETSNPDQKDFDGDELGDACDDDSDNDGMTDEWEELYGLNIFEDDSELDNDEDGLTNIEEFKHRTSPLASDTDGDGHDDAKEIKKGTNPIDKNSKPGRNRIITFFIWLVILGGIGGAIGYLYIRRINKGFGSVNSVKEEFEKTKQQDMINERPQSPAFAQQTQTMPPRQPIAPERKYRPAPLFKPAPPPQRHVKQNADNLLEEHSKLSGEEVFDRLERHTKRRL